MSKPPADSSAPTSLGWLAAHAMDGDSASPWRSAVFARAAAEGLRALAGGKPETDSAWDGFSRPFRAIEDHVASILDPLRAKADVPLAGIGEAAGAALRGLAAPKRQKSSDRTLAGIGSAIGEALSGGEAPLAPKAATWVETGNPSLRRASARGPAPIAQGKPPAGKPAPAKTAPRSGPAAPSTPPASTSRPKRAPTAPELAPLSRADLPPAPTAFAAFAEEMERKLHRARERARQRAPKPAQKPSAPVHPARTPFVYPEDPADMARFREILSRRAPGTPAAPGNESVIPADAVTPVSPPWPGLPAPSQPGIGDVRQRLPSPGPRPSAPEPTDVFTPIQTPDPARGPVPASTQPAPSPRGPAAGASVGESAPAAPAPHPHASEMEWLDEEDDLAARLHSLLRRQARRRGVDLS